MTQTMAIERTNGASIIESVLIAGDLSKLTADQRISYYRETCSSLGLNELTKPFEYITLNGKLTLYATRTCTDQLRAIRGVSVQIVGRDRLDDVYVVTARATTAEGRVDESTGVVSLGTLRGEALANALMKCETKAKRRVTLSICGLGWMDESEVESVPQARKTPVNHATGEVIEYVPLHEQQAEQAAPEQEQEKQAEEEIPSSDYLNKWWAGMVQTAHEYLTPAQVAKLPVVTGKTTDLQLFTWCRQLEDRINAAAQQREASKQQAATAETESLVF